jgi:hypothetical protein
MGRAQDMGVKDKTRRALNSDPVQENGEIPKIVYGFQDYWSPWGRWAIN